MKNSDQSNNAFLDRLRAEAHTKKFRQFSEQAVSSPHPSAERLYDYATGNIDEDIALGVRAHLAGCAACAREALSIMRLDDELEHASVEWANQPELSVVASSEKLIAEAVDATVAAVKTFGARALVWISELWEPQWAGQLLTAADVPEQIHTFTSEYGDIHLTCHWQDASRNEPASLHIMWQADLMDNDRLWLRFVNPENRELRQAILLGTRAVGEETFTAQDVAFDFLREAWAISLALDNMAA